MAQSTISCPLCSLPLSPSSLESHLRQELSLPAFRCLLCSLHFASEERARGHFAGPLAKHPGQPSQLMDLEGEPEKEARLVELVRLARGGQREVEKRLCVCGQCQLMCREDFRYTSGNEEERAPVNFSAPVHQNETINTMGDRGYQEPEPQTTNYAQANTAPNKATARFTQSEESQEEEVMMPVEVKPDLNDLKPQIYKDGKMACIQCGMRIGKGMFKQHAVGAHSTARPFSCNLCPHNEKTKGALAKHQSKEHGQTLSEDTFIFAGSEDKIREIIEQCFGSAKETDWFRMRCQPCDKLVNAKALKQHIALSHIMKALHFCKLCDYTYRDFSAGKMNVHVKNVHKQRPGTDTIDSSQAQHYAPIIKNMIPQLFSKE